MEDSLARFLYSLLFIKSIIIIFLGERSKERLQD